MRCPRCGQPVPGLACLPCTALQSRQALFARQPSHLADVRRGRLHFFAARLSSQHPWHLMLFGDRAHAWCGLEILHPSKAGRREIRYDQLAEFAEPKELCPKCRAALAAMEQPHAVREES